MVNVTHNLGLDLPVFDIGREIVRPSIGIPDHAGPTFLRHIYIDYARHYGTTSLKEVLARTDDILEDVAQQCGALVVSHQWGLRKAGAEYIVSDLLPRGYFLAAEVERVTQTCTLQPIHLQRISAYSESESFKEGVGGYAWSDFKSHQFMYGTSATRSSHELFLVDIEPMIVKV